MGRHLVPRLRDEGYDVEETDRELEQLKLKLATGAEEEAQVRTVHGIPVHAQRADGMDGPGLRALADRIRDRLRSGVIALGAANDGKVAWLVVVKKDWVQKLRAGDLIRDMGLEVGGTGGGRPEMAQAGGKNPERLGVALEKVFELVERAVEG